MQSCQVIHDRHWLGCCPRKESTMGTKKSKNSAFLAIYAHGYTLSLCTADSSLYLPLRKFPIQLAHLNALLHLQLLPDFTKTLSSLPHEFHSLPSRSRLCPSFSSHGTSTTSTGTDNDCPFLFPDLLIYTLQIPQQNSSLPSLTRANTQTQNYLLHFLEDSHNAFSSPPLPEALILRDTAPGLLRGQK